MIVIKLNGNHLFLNLHILIIDNWIIFNLSKSELKVKLLLYIYR